MLKHNDPSVLHQPILNLERAGQPYTAKAKSPPLQLLLVGECNQRHGTFRCNQGIGTCHVVVQGDGHIPVQALDDHIRAVASHNQALDGRFLSHGGSRDGQHQGHCKFAEH
jgi:hypothetical protein